jgi:hypothetical protein
MYVTILSLFQKNNKERNWSSSLGDIISEQREEQDLDFSSGL